MTTSADLRSRRFVLLVPVGAHEQHGPHLPLDTDTRIAVAVCRRAADRLPWVELGPPLTVSASDEHAGFVGTLSLGTDLTAEVIAAIALSAVANSPTCAGTVFVNAHGGNRDSLVRVERALDEVPAAFWSVPAAPGADLHAGRTETSMMLAIDPDLVRLDRAEPGDIRPLAEILPTMRTAGVGAVSANGVLGDPTGASADEGAALLDRAVADLLGFLERCLLDWGGSTPESGAPIGA